MIVDSLEKRTVKTRIAIGDGEDTGKAIAALRSVLQAHAVIATHPELIRDRIRAGVESGFSGDLGRHRVELPDHFEFRLRFHQPKLAYQRSFYPGAWLEGEDTVAFSTDDYFEVLRLIRFMT